MFGYVIHLQVRLWPLAENKFIYIINMICCNRLAILKENSVSAEESRSAVEAVARHLLDRLESENDLSENSLGPWQNTYAKYWQIKNTLILIFLNMLYIVFVYLNLNLWNRGHQKMMHV